MSYQTLNVDVSDGVATITLNRPNSMNAMSPQMGAELHEVALAIDADPAIRAVVLTGAGKVFCAGGDLGEFAAAGDGARTLIMKMTADPHLALSRLARNAAPVIAAVVAAAGAGFSLLMAADLAIAAECGYDHGLHQCGFITGRQFHLLHAPQDGDRRARRIDADQSRAQCSGSAGLGCGEPSGC